MPAAAPAPRGPSVIALGDAEALLTAPGCPICRHVTESADRYLAWFAIEAHADTVSLTRLCASLGMCARHTRFAAGQPGAGPRLTAVYRYVLEAAADQLARRSPRLAPCPACEHDAAVTDRVLGTLMDELSGHGVRQRHLETGGLCLPHLRAAAGVRRYRAQVGWAVRVRTATELPGAGQAGPVAPGWSGLHAVAGGPDHDAPERARWRGHAAGGARGARQRDLAVAPPASGRW